MNERAAPLLEEYDVRGGGCEALALSLSGGNQQKVVIAPEISEDPKVLVAAQPTRGLDVERASVSVVEARVVGDVAADDARGGGSHLRQLLAQARPRSARRAGNRKSANECVSSPQTAGGPGVLEEDGERTGMPPKVSISIRVSAVSAAQRHAHLELLPGSRRAQAAH